MTNDSLYPHLEAIGRQLTIAAHDLASPPRRSRRRPLRLVAASTTGLAMIATAALLAVGATTATPPAFAVTRHDHGSVSLKINRPTSIAEVNRKLAAMGIEKIGRGSSATDNASSIPPCSSIPAGWKGVWVKMAGPTSGPGYTVTSTVAPGTWLHVFCAIRNPGNPGSGNTSNG